jgi:hypothetical protein
LNITREREKKKKKKKKVMSKGEVRVTFMRGEKKRHLLEGSQGMSARPSGRSKMKIKVYEEDVRMATVVV